MQSVNRLLELMKLLRDPERGCPWDREQTPASILPYTLEEAYELAGAVEEGDAVGEMNELGDLLFHVVFYAQMAAEAGRFSFTDVVEGINTKLERRHPHVFGDARVEGAAHVSRQWERIKSQERRDAGEGGLMDGLPRTLPALLRALKVQKRAASVGFDWDSADPALDKVQEELGELRQALSEAPGGSAVNEEVGDLLFSVVNCARHAGIDPEGALRAAVRKFEQRFALIEAELGRRGKTLEEASLEEMDQIWELAKERMRTA